MLRITDIQENRVDWDAVPFCEITKSEMERYRLRKWDLVFARTGATVGKSFLIRDDRSDSVYASYLIRVRCIDESLAIFLSHFFNSPAYWDQITDFSAGIGQPNVNGSKLKGLSIPLAPLAEQKVIADRLDALLAQVDTLQARLGAIPAILKRFRQSVLSAAVSGKLTEEWREGNSGIWKASTLGETVEEIVDCPHSTPVWSDTGYICVRTTGFKPFFLDLSEQGFVSNAVYEERTKRIKPQAGDILYSREGTVGVACQIPNGVDLCLGQRMILIRAGEKILDRFLTIVLNSDETLSVVRSLIMGSTAPRINVKDIKAYRIPQPSLLEQTEIVRRVESLFAFADQIEARLQEATARVKHLTQSILAKAFRGELTEEWRQAHPELVSGENSAAALLERIRTARAEVADAKGKRGRKASSAPDSSVLMAAESASPKKRGRPLKVSS